MNGSLSTLSNRLDWLRNEFEQALGNGQAPEFVPSLDIREDADHFMVDVEVPGLKAGDIEVTFADNEMTLKGERKWEKKEGEVWHRAERGYGAFLRKVTFPAPVNGERIEATFEDGILTVKLPKAEEAKPRKVQIQYLGKK